MPYESMSITEKEYETLKKKMKRNDDACRDDEFHFMEIYDRKPTTPGNTVSIKKRTRREAPGDKKTFFRKLIEVN